ncbi:MAG: DUF1080 domain-containing protein, partial [bacterium]|nr:DUF1080 domain-containing protein [bacterium]
MMIRIVATLSISLALTAGAADGDASALYPDSIGPYAGDWEGMWSSGEKKHPWIGAQVIALGNGEFEVVLTRKLYARAPLFKKVAAKAEGDAMVFDDGEYYGTIAGKAFTGGRRGDKPGEFALDRYIWESPNLGMKPPKKAIVLFDGSGFDEWQPSSKGKWWDILPGNVMQANPDNDSLYTEREFADVRLHLEFRLPFMPEKRGQSRANSGVFLQKYFEVQILDSYGLPGYWNECGAIYQISGPRVNMCAPPLQWQSYDIEFRSARFDKKGNLVENPRMTVVHNGVPVQTDIEMPRGTSGDFKKKPVAPPKEPQRIRLQAHHNCVQFRNIW